VSAKSRCRVRVPASSANLGPGFDVLAAALAIHLEVEVVETGSFAVVTDLDVPRDRQNLVVRAFERWLCAERFEFRIRSAIPLSGGLGSSAAAVVAGLMAAAAIDRQAADVLSAAAEIEGHPDNAAAALRGGIVICDGARSVGLRPPAGLAAVLVVPADAVVTEEARAVLPRLVPMADATANLASIATLTLGLARGDFELIAAGLRDRLHQRYRASLYPRSAALLERAPELGALGATISGAGPSVLIWARERSVADVVAALAPEAAGWAQILAVSFEPDGASVL
jgi:homoserine kinase